MNGPRLELADVLISAFLTDITEQPMTWQNWYKHVDWLNTTFIIFVPLLGLVSAYWVPLQTKTAIFTVAYYFYSGLGISKPQPRPRK